MILNRSHINKAKGNKNTPTIQQFNSIGYSAPFLGWEEEILGKEFTPDQLCRFMNKTKLNVKKKIRKKRKSKPQNDYSHPKWIIKRKRIYKRDNHKCVHCNKSDTKLNAHHLLYQSGKAIWEVPDYYIVTLCEKCHKAEHRKKLNAPSKKTW